MLTFIVNPTAGSGHALKIEAQLRAELDKRDIQAVFLRTGAPGHATQLARQAAEQADCTGVVAVGATAELIPECPVDFEQDVVEKIRQARLSGRTHFMVVAAEGAGSGFEIAKRIQDEMTYPGQVKITVIRETRSVSYAK